ncbi:lachesin-like [Mercenaria mercenaria]|uniref:lachesin-like n=1 Tax=Mercenaria mercenaria TaxID=6596 RepID=UPI00234EF257|nr:lachesin-like [Mercenaria mercenaria]
MRLLLTACILVWNIVVSQLAKAGDPVMETTKHIQISLIQGKTAILPCMISFRDVDDDDKRKYSVIWTDRRGRTISINERVMTNHRKFEISHPYPNEWNLKVIRVRNTDSGEYKCQVNTDPVQTKVVVLIVQVPPRIYSSESVEVKETERLVIYCNVTGDPPPTVRWYKENENLPQYSGEVLVIEKALRNDSGIYKCEAENGIEPSDSEDITVDVLYAPTVQLSTNRISQYRYKSIVLDCNVIANPKEKVSWYKNGKPLYTNWKYKIEEFGQSDGSRTHTLEIGYLERLDFGDYVCMAINSAGTASEVVTVAEITTSTAVTKTEDPRTTLKPGKPTAVTTPDFEKISSSRISLSSSTSDSVSYIPDKSEQKDNVVVVPDSSSRASFCGNIQLSVSIVLIFIFL